MLRGSTIGVVVPAHNEALHIQQVLRGMPPFVDHIYVVDDASTDDTCELAAGAHDDRARVVRHDHNRGVGAAIVTGYRAAMAQGDQVVAVMAGDAQMDPDDLDSVLGPVIDGIVDYVKGNRLAHPSAHQMPFARRMGTRVLGAMTRVSLGFPALSDSQCGFTAISAAALAAIDLDDLWPRFGYPNDLLAKLSASGLRVGEVVVRPIYSGQASELRLYHVAVIAWLIARGGWRLRRCRSRDR